MDRIPFGVAAVRLCLGFGSLFLLGAAGPSALQLGHIVKAQKISATSGGFGAVLEEMDQFGRSIVNLGDLDGDGLTDVLVGAHTDDDGALDQGSIYVLFLRANGFVKGWQKISELEGNFAGRLRRGDQFGRAAANLGDLDGDGVVDLAVSANYDDTGGANKGAVYILFLNTDGTVKQSQKICEGEGGLPITLNIHDEFGRSLTALGDLDGDGLSELLVGTPEDDEGGTNTGALHVLFLNANGTVKDYRRISKFSSGLALKPGDRFGFCTANMGDLDGDGVVDIAAGSVLDDDGGTNQGSLWILFLNPDGSVKSARELDELDGGLPPFDDIDQFGTSVANLGDLDGDGLTDIAVGAVKDDDGGTEGNPDADVGAVYVLFLNADASVREWVKLSDTSGSLPFALDQWDWFGSALAPLGGSSGDGLFNLAIGCRNDDDAGGNHGAIYLVQLNDGTAPGAQFTATPSSGVAPLTVEFTDTSSGNVTGWLWNFGDGGPASTQQNPSRTYSVPGTYDVQLIARGPTGVDPEIKRGLITVANSVLAAFDAGPRSGPCPLSVTFTDLSMGAITSWSWDFGDGQTSTLANPGHLYTDCGTYTVSLTVTGPNGTDTRVESDFVVAALVPPAADFSATPSSGPVPLDVQFDDATVGQVTSWSWDFGDGQFSDLASPLHQYTAEGTYTVTLTATGPGGNDVETRSACVRVTGPPPSAYFEANPTIGPEPLTVSFLDVTTGLVSSWAWDFGDGASSSERHPLHTYSAPGVYTVTLSVDGPNGPDVRVLTDLITVEPGVPAAAFGAAPTSGPAPLAVQFTDLSTLTVTSWAWDFGDGTGSSAENPQHVYVTPGLYTVALTVSGPGGSDTLTLADLITVSVPPTSADFDAVPTTGAAPLTVTFEDLSSANVTAWSWDFGDGTGSSAEDPQHVYAAPGTYDVTLSVTSATGSDLRTRAGLITVLPPPPEPGFEATPSVGTAPLPVQFEDKTTGLVSAWSWDFGDGTSSREPEPLHVFSAPGFYEVSLTVTGPGGSNTLTRAEAVEVIPPAPEAFFGAAPTLGPAPLTVQFSDASSGAVTSWAWSFGDGGTSSAASPTHVYAAPGTYTVTLLTRGPGGADQLVKTDLVTVQVPAPVAGFSAAPTTGVAPLTVQFGDLSSGPVTSWAWTFGDGATSSAASPAHVYSTPGTYTVSLSASGPGGTDVEIQAGLVTVQAPAPVAGFTAAPTTGEAPLTVQFGDLSSGPVTAWAWSFGDGATSSAASPAHVYTTPGTYTVSLSASGPGGTDVEIQTDLVTVASSVPVAAFGAAPSAGFAPLPVQFSDSSSGAITTWSWDFGDGTSSSEPSPAHVYDQPGTYTVTLAVSGPGGSDDEVRAGFVQVSAPPPLAEFQVTPREGFAPLQVTFLDQSTGLVTAWAWNFGDGQVSNLASPAHVFTEPDSYVVTLEVTGPGGSSLRRRTILVHEPPVFADGGFELQTPGLAPGAPWTVYNGNSVVVRPTSVGSDQGFPSAGASWLDIGAEGSSSARPPSNPGGPSTSPAGACGVQQDFLFPSATPFLVFEAAFLLNGTPRSPGRNDFMSVDLTDGLTVHNVFYADSFAEFPLVSAQHGLAMTALESVRVDLRALFPTASEFTVLSLRASVGNVGGSPAPSRAYVDSFRLAPAATATFRNGHDLNPAVYTCSPPVVGGVWTLDIDTSARPEARYAFVIARTQALGGLAGEGGELLIAGPLLFRLTLPLSGGLDHFEMAVPNDPALLGLTSSTQASLYGAGLVRANAFDLRLGY